MVSGGGVGDSAIRAAQSGAVYAAGAPLPPRLDSRDAAPAVALTSPATPFTGCAAEAVRMAGEEETVAVIQPNGRE